MDAALGAFSGVLRILQSGVSSNWWGLACPSHCGPPSFGLLLSAFLLGFILCLGCLASLALWFLWGSSSVPQPPAAPAAPTSRLARYLDGSTGPDSDIVELSVQLAGLSITVRGSPARAADFVRDLTESPPRSSHPGVESSVASEPSLLSWTSSAAAPVDSRTSILASFPPCPGHWLLVSHRLTSSRLPGAQRIRRAWIAGCWARAVREGRIGSPNQTEAIELPNRFWCVVHCEHLSRPRVFSTSGAFFAAVGRVQGSTTICHGFPSETEARCYFEAAGETYPSTLN